MMGGFTGATKSVMTDIKFAAHLYEVGGHFVRKLYSIDTCFPGSLDHFQAMLVGSGDQADIATTQAIKSGDGIGGNRLIGVANVRTTIGIADRGGNIKWFGHNHLS